MNIEESNKLIAEFMKAKLAADGSYVFPINFDRNWAGDIARVENMKFHTSWDWLMPVVEKINNTKDEDGNLYSVTIGNGYVWVDHHLGTRIFFSGNEIHHRDEPMISKVFRGVVEFIKWYNENIS